MIKKFLVKDLNNNFGDPLFEDIWIPNNSTEVPSPPLNISLRMAALCVCVNSRGWYSENLDDVSRSVIYKIDRIKPPEDDKGR